jgi:hypothetical protein
MTRTPVRDVPAQLFAISKSITRKGEGAVRWVAPWSYPLGATPSPLRGGMGSGATPYLA